jgi:tetratricopeptide (TPR) repeat protein
MALIKCEECGHEISDMAESCPNCGCPIEKNNVNDLNFKQNKLVVKPNKRMKIVVVLALVGIIIFVIIGFYSVQFIKTKNIYSKAMVLFEQGKYEEANIIFDKIERYKNVDEIKKQINTYKEAMTLLEQGKYEDANKLFNTIPDFKDIKKIQEQLKYESMAYSAINSLKSRLKNPDSFQPYDITFYKSMGKDSDSLDEKISKIFNEYNDSQNPICIIHYGAQNGFGGNTPGYMISSYDKSLNSYTLIGTCDTLNEVDYDQNDQEDIYNLIICKAINLYKNGNDIIGIIDLERIKNLLKNDAYSTIKIIE